ncbi:protein FAM124B [Hyla sarda]|uniref:protein FAM124B n=1 Tax=Hyla sarda TaxID=327740 RepID=UPI0024C3B9A4|nr:protein FAM124B [Hyla sarda]XP_056420869.1 protein FAM124B [Hyla sarda]XP_056420870.1 protein FAM124B [Hyla sarda]
MDGTHTGLPVTIHLLANPGDSTVFRQAVKHILQGLCLDSKLFLVSERAAPIQCYEYQKRRFEFPGISVLLFLREDLGEERISLLQSFFQLPPWDHVNTGFGQGSSQSSCQTRDDFYCLDVHMPVWGIRQVHYGAEILRITLYCDFDNYEDAVRLYEMILGMEATSQKIGFCFFTLHSTKHTSIQFSLKQMPPGVCAQVKHACALQFNIQAIGQLVPLLPYPCVPISDTRWQTQDYDGNKILLLVTGGGTTVSQNDGKFDKSNAECPSSSFTAQSSFTQPTQTMHSEDKIVPGNQVFKKNLNASEQRQNVCSITDNNLPKLMPRPYLHPDETETNVDTGHRVINMTHQLHSIYRMSRDLQNIPQYKPNQDLPCKQGDSSCHLAVKENKGADIKTKIFPSQRLHSNSKELIEEFFI